MTAGRPFGDIRRAAAAAALVTVVASACQAGSTARTASPSARSSEGSTGPTASSSGPTAGTHTSRPSSGAGGGSALPTGSKPSGTVMAGSGVRYEPVLDLAVPHEMNLLALSDQTLAYAQASGATSHLDEVVVVSLRSGRRRVVARSGFPHGLVDWVAVTGHTVVYTDQDRVPSTANPRNRWRLEAVDLVTGQRRLLASSGDRAQPWVPTPRASEGDVVWAQLQDPGNLRKGLEVRQWRQGWSGPRVLLTHSRLSSGSGAVTDGRFVFVQTEPHLVAGSYAQDVFSVPLSGGHITQISHNGTVQWMNAANGQVVWSQKKSRTRQGLADPYSHWVAPVDGSAPPRQIQQGYSASNVVVGHDFAALWPTGDGVLVTSLDGRNSTKIQASTYVPARLAASGALLAYGTQVGHDEVHLRVLRIDPS